MRNFDFGFTRPITKPKPASKDEPTNRYRTTADSILKEIENKSKESIQLENKYLKDYYSLEVSLILNYILDKARNRKEILPVAFELRESKDARAFRKQLRMLDENASIGNSDAVSYIIREMDDKIKSLNKKIDKPVVDIEVAYPFSATLKISQLLRPAIELINRPRNRHLIFINKLYEAGKQARPIRRQIGKLFG